MGERIEPGQAEEPLRGEEPDAEGAVVDEAHRDPAGLRHRGQHQRVGPDGEAAEEPADGTRPGAAAPVHAAEERRGELRHGGEADQPDRDQRIGLARDAEVEVAEQQHEDDRRAADVEQEPRQVAAGPRPEAVEPEQRRHDQVVADHGRDRDRLDDQHAGDGGEPADVGEERDRRRPLGQRQRRARRSRHRRPRAPLSSRPPRAIGSTKTLIRSR